MPPRLISHHDSPHNPRLTFFNDYYFSVAERQKKVRNLRQALTNLTPPRKFALLNYPEVIDPCDQKSSRRHKRMLARMANQNPKQEFHRPRLPT